MAEEKTTLEQIEANARYHRRNETIKEVAFANILLRNYFGAPAELADTRFRGMNAFLVSIALPGGGVLSVPFLLVVGGDETAPAPVVQTSISGEVWARMPTEGPFTNSFYGARVFQPSPTSITVIIVGENEEIQKEDGGEFFSKNTGGTKTLKDVETNGNGTWLAVGDDGKILKSTDDGENWSDKSISSTYDLMGIRYKNGRFVALDDNGGYHYSNDDGESWVSGTIDVSPYTIDEINGMFFDGTRFIGYGELENGDEYPGLIVSENGKDWSVVLPIPEGYGGLGIAGERLNEVCGVAYDSENGIYICFHSVGVMTISYDNMETWIARPAPGRSISKDAIVFIEETFYLVIETRQNGDSYPYAGRTQRYT